MPVLTLLALLALTPGCGVPSAAPEATAPAGALPDPIYDAYDLFVVAGQSNARGRGEAALSPVVPAGAAYEVLQSGSVVPLADPVGRANTGSAWPAFANAYSEATGRGVVIVGQAAGGTAQVALAGDGPTGHWDVRQPDNRYTRADRVARRALAVAERELPGVRPAGWLWIQGGSDMRRIQDGRLSLDEYREGLHALARRVGSDWGVPLYLFVSGTDAREDTPAAAAVREVQNEAGALDEVVVVYREAYTFPARGWMLPDHIHWSQDGLDEAGREGAAVAAEDQALRVGTSENPQASGFSEGVVAFPNPSARAPHLNAGCPFLYAVVDARGRLVARGQGSGPTPLPALPVGAYVAQVRPRAGTAPACTGSVPFVVAR